jgi:23S rRNA (uracil1939-C5)-methyltransferase
VGDTETAMVFRHLVDLSDADIEILNAFSEKYNVSVYLQSGGPDTVKPIKSNKKECLTYRLDDHDLVIEFNPTSFIQINADINKAMINRVLDLLEPQSEESVLDLFCGLGNITLPLARYSGNVTGIEGDKNLIEQAKLNARRNRINNVEFYMEDLANIDQQAAYINKSYHKIVLDPPRTGAQEIITAMDLSNVSKLVYVSCNPATLARDAGILVRERGLILTQAGVMDMFPHTSHVESVALFEQ